MNINSLLESPSLTCPLVVARILPPSCLPRQPLFAKIFPHFLKNEVLPLLKERGNNITVYHSPIGFRNAKARNNYCLTVYERWKRCKKKERECCLLSTVFVILRDSWIRLMVRVTEDGSPGAENLENLAPQPARNRIFSENSVHMVLPRIPGAVLQTIQT
jgi:hypothetical protein